MSGESTTEWKVKRVRELAKDHFREASNWRFEMRHEMRDWAAEQVATRERKTGRALMDAAAALERVDRISARLAFVELELKRVAGVA